MSSSDSIRMEFHISRKARDFYQFDKSMFTLSGNVIFADFHASRLFAQKMNDKRDLLYFPEKTIKAGQINAMGLIDEILHLVINLYREQQSPGVMSKALVWLNDNLGKEKVDLALSGFINEFPPTAIYQRDISINDYLAGSTNGHPNRQIIIEEMLMLWLANMNPAFSPFIELFDDSNLKKVTIYSQITSSLQVFFKSQPTFGPDNQNLVEMLQSPAIAEPYSLPGQIEYIRKHWGFLLKKYFYRFLTTLDLIKEEEKPIFGTGGEGSSRVYEFTGQEFEKERFSLDREWMPRLVLIAKNAYVWLDQLSKKYNKPMNKLSDIPDEELKMLSEWGFTGLWLIGLWERSHASKNIKIMRGNPEAVASAYSLYDYTIAEDLGGESAYQNLNERAFAKGIRLVSDMVPNHMGIDSRWVVEHPDWFISLNYPPFPVYSFNGPNFSPDNRVGIYIEDHYFTNTDASVVFKRVDFNSGDTKYIYHGNDGTSMPWNDTAQLNFLNPEVREAVIQTILHVARKFSVIRFDAAMTLAKKHYQRLWFPEPGTGGAIPSRTEFGLTRDQFDAAIPEEFWREVVDRVTKEMPDTLLLAEAFWLMEGYFVRTLGMHRVYNSAFMNMLRDEKNAEYRTVIKNTLEFDPEILKRYVNFMNNPDEKTAVEQFGSGDKYFGICTIMITMPGLPMFGHGQIEGYTEKYGMEYRKAYWDEKQDQWLIDRHKNEIFPLLKKRRLFADVQEFLLYDFFTSEGTVNENVFAFSNRSGDDRSLVIYHNKYASTSGWIKTSAAFAVKLEGTEKKIIRKSLSEGLNLINDKDRFTVFRDQTTNLEYIRQNHEIISKGLFIDLEAYKCHVFYDFRQLQDNEWHQYSSLVEYLQGRGVESIEEAMKELFLQPIHNSYRELFNSGFFNWVIDHRIPKPTKRKDVAKLLKETNQKVKSLLQEVKKQSNGNGDENIIADEKCNMLLTLLNLNLPVNGYKDSKNQEFIDSINFILKPELSDSISKLADGFNEGDKNIWGILLSWLFNFDLGRIVKESDYADLSRSWLDEWLLNKLIVGTLQDLGFSKDSSWQSTALVKLLVEHGGWWKIDKSAILNSEIKIEEIRKDASFILHQWLMDSEVQQFLGINRHQGVLWFNKEAFESWLWWMLFVATIQIISKEHLDFSKPVKLSSPEVINCYHIILKLLKASDNSEYQVEKLFEFIK
jgi:glycosidase